MSRDVNIKNDNMNALIDMVHQIGLDAFVAYKPIADNLCSRIAAADEVEHTLDLMLDFCGYDNFLPLFKQVCRHYLKIYPDIIGYEIKSYRNIYDDEKG